MDGEKNLYKIFHDDGIANVDINSSANKSVTSFEEIGRKMGEPPWAVRIVYNERFGGVLIAQKPGEGNRLHYHPDTDECWVIIKGEWEWFIEGEGTKKVYENDIVLVKNNKKHCIKVVGKEPGIRFAITKPDVEHVFIEGHK